MGVTTSLHIVSSGKASLKTTVPVFIVKQFNLKQGDKLDWYIDIHNNEMVIIIKKIN
jgi:bifunctional DNA-binding transcriptional regulator/antitoxin component of YhaV-PrlF toxin-antitoxin module